MILKPTQMVQFLTNMFTIQIPVLLTGAPGIGKSDVVAAACKAIDADVILSHPAVADPTDAKGLPWIVDKLATFLPFGDLRRAIEAKRPTIWFLDDLGQAAAAVQASFMQLLLAREVNGHRISDFVTFAMATNRRSDRAGVTGILEPVKSRGVIVELATDLDDWCLWAINNGLSPELIAYLRFCPDQLSAFVPTADLTNSPSPRSWSFVDRIFKLNMQQDLQFAGFAGAVGEGAAVGFNGFLKIYRELPSVDAILIDPNSVDIPTQPATLYALSGALAHKATAANFDRIGQFVQRMVDHGRAEFGVLILKDSMQRCKAKGIDLTKTQAFVKLATSEIGQLISGK